MNESHADLRNTLGGGIMLTLLGSILLTLAWPDGSGGSRLGFVISLLVVAAGAGLLLVVLIAHGVRLGIAASRVTER